MANTANPILPCDGCAQPAGSVHIARRLERLAWSTRFRPLHIQALLLIGVAPQQNSDFLYAPDSLLHGEAAAILQAVQLNPAGKSVEAVLTEFQKLGLMLTHVLECPLEDGAHAAALLEKQLPIAMVRIRRSLKPKRVLVLGNDLLPFAAKIHEANLVCPVLPAGQGAFLPTLAPSDSELLSFREALVLSPARSA